MRGRIHSREFKLECVRQVTRGEKRPRPEGTRVCREHSLDEGVLLRWRKEVETRGEAAAFTARDVSDLSEVERLEKRIAELERHCGQLSLENSLLKKLAQTVAQRNGTK